MCRGASASARAGAPFPGAAGNGWWLCRLPFLPEVPSSPCRHEGLRKASGQGLCPSQGWGPRPRGCCALGVPGARGVGWAHGLGEVAAPGDGSCDHELSARTSSSCSLDGAWPSAQCAHFRATAWTPRTTGADSTELRHYSLRPKTAGRRPVPLAQRLLPHPGCAACAARRLRARSPRTPAWVSTLTGPRIQLRLRLCAQLGSPQVRYIPACKVRAATAGPRSSCYCPPVARGEGGDTGWGGGKGGGEARLWPGPAGRGR